MSELTTAGYETYLEQIYLMTKTFASLQLDGRVAICDSLLAMFTTFVEVSGAVLLVDQESGALEAGATRGDVLAEELSPAVTLELLKLVDEGTARHLPISHVERLAPSLASRVGALAVAGLYAGDKTLGLIVIEHRGGANDTALLRFLSATAGICSLAITSADALADARTLASSLARTAAATKRESAEKTTLLDAIHDQLRTIHEQQQQLDSLAFPLLAVSKRIAVAPVIGKVDAERGETFAKRILAGIAASRAEVLIIDVTGALLEGDSSASSLLTVVKSVRLLGIVVAITGMQPALASMLGEEGLRSLRGIETFATLESGLRHFTQRS